MLAMITRGRGRLQLARLKIEPCTLDRRVANDGTIDPAAPDGTCDILDFLLIEIRSNLDHDLGLERLLDGQVVPLGHDFAEKTREECLALEASKTGGVG